MLITLVDSINQETHGESIRTTNKESKFKRKNLLKFLGLFFFDI